MCPNLKRGQRIADHISRIHGLAINAHGKVTIFGQTPFLRSLWQSRLGRSWRRVWHIE